MRVPFIILATLYISFIFYQIHLSKEKVPIHNKQFENSLVATKWTYATVYGVLKILLMSLSLVSYFDDLDSYHDGSKQWVILNCF